MPWVTSQCSRPGKLLSRWTAPRLATATIVVAMRYKRALGTNGICAVVIDRTQAFAGLRRYRRWKLMSTRSMPDEGFREQPVHRNLNNRAFWGLSRRRE